MTIFSLNNLSKAYNDNILFEGVSFGVEEGERIGLIGRNGAGKTTLLKIIAGLEYPDEGEVVFNKSTKLKYLDQEPALDVNELILEAVMKSRGRLYDLLEEYKRLCYGAERNDGRDRIEELTIIIDNMNGWSLENEAKKTLSLLGVTDLYQKTGVLSGGMKKRVALAQALISDPTLLILDEPTNHLDADSAQWLQDRLMNSSKSLLLVTHDRYFLDAVATKIIEIDLKRIFSFPGNYEKYLVLKESSSRARDSAAEHTRSKLRMELAWLQKGAKARRCKQKSRIDWIAQIKDEAKKNVEKKIKIELGKTFLGSRIIDAHNITKSIGGKLLFENFTYIAKPKDRIGVIGPNGSGKSTLLNTLSGRVPPDNGAVKHGATLKLGYFEQEMSGLKDSQTVVGALRDIAEYIDVGVGRNRYLTTKDLLNKFLFPPARHTALISTLSGGEKRRLVLLRTLMANPNAIFLDEPTNDLDIPTLNALENYLDDFYGALIIVSHDRAFLDRTVDFIFSFDGRGGIKEYPGNYSAYLEKKETEKRKAGQDLAEKRNRPKHSSNKTGKIKLSYMDQREFDALENNIAAMEKLKAGIEEAISKISGANYSKLEKLSRELVELENKIDAALERWMELSERA